MSVINTYAKGQYGTITTIIDSPTNQKDKPVGYCVNCVQNAQCDTAYTPVKSDACGGGCNVADFCRVSAMDALTTWSDTAPLAPIIPAIQSASWRTDNIQSSAGAGNWAGQLIRRGKIACVWDVGALFMDKALKVFQDHANPTPDQLNAVRLQYCHYLSSGAAGGGIPQITSDCVQLCQMQTNQANRTACQYDLRQYCSKFTDADTAPDYCQCFLSAQTYDKYYSDQVKDLPPAIQGQIKNMMQYGGVYCSYPACNIQPNWFPASDRNCPSKNIQECVQIVNAQLKGKQVGGNVKIDQQCNLTNIGPSPSPSPTPNPSPSPTPNPSPIPNSPPPSTPGQSLIPLQPPNSGSPPPSSSNGDNNKPAINMNIVYIGIGVVALLIVILMIVIFI